MDNKLYTYFYNILECNQDVLDEIEPYDHPLLSLLSESLTNQYCNLKQLVEKSHNNTPNLEEIKKNCAIVYHANQVANPFYEQWGRAIKWIDSPSEAIFESVGKKIENMQKALEKAAEELQKAYGEMEVKYFIPTFYLS